MEVNKFTLQQLLAGEDIYVVAVPEGGAFMSESRVLTPPSGVGATNASGLLFRPKHKVVILVHELNPTDVELLEKILGAVQLTLPTVEVVEMSKNPNMDLSHIFTQNGYKTEKYFFCKLKPV